MLAKIEFQGRITTGRIVAKDGQSVTIETAPNHVITYGREHVIETLRNDDPLTHGDRVQHVSGGSIGRIETVERDGMAGVRLPYGTRAFYPLEALRRV